MSKSDIAGIAPFFIVRSVPAALAFYRDRLGFEIMFQGPDPDDIFFGIVKRGAAMIMLKDVGVDPLPNCQRDVGKGWARWDAYLDVPDPEALAAEFSSHGVEFSQPLKDDEDGLRGFEVKDADGYVLFFWPSSFVTAIIVSVFFGATLVRATLGFGEALIAVPLLAFVLPVEIAAPIATLISITVAAAVTAQDWRHVEARSAATLVLYSLIGIPIGLLLLRRVPEPIVKGLLGALVAAFAASALRRPPRHALIDDRFAWLFGIGAGVLGGAYGMNGPPLVVYGTLRGWTPQRFRATLQGYFLPASVMGMVGYWTAGLWTPAVTHYYLVSLPAVVVAIALGRILHSRIDARRFRIVVHAGLLASGAGLVLQSIL